MKRSFDFLVKFIDHLAVDIHELKIKLSSNLALEFDCFEGISESSRLLIRQIIKRLSVAHYRTFDLVHQVIRWYRCLELLESEKFRCLDQSQYAC